MSTDCRPSYGLRPDAFRANLYVPADAGSTQELPGNREATRVFRFTAHSARVAKSRSASGGLKFVPAAAPSPRTRAYRDTRRVAHALVHNAAL